MRTIKEMSQLSGLSVRTLHYYDEIGLLKPTLVGENGYRFYDDEVLPRLQEILLFRELEFPLKDIQKILEASHYKRYAALGDQIKLLEIKKARLEEVIIHAKSLKEGGKTMSHFTAYDESEVKAFQKEAKERWGNTAAYQSYEQKSSDVDAELVSQEMHQLMTDFGLLKDLPVDDQVVQVQVKKLQDYITDHFYPCTNEILAGLGQMYVEDERFKKNIDSSGGQGTASFISSAISHYCK